MARLKEDLTAAQKIEVIKGAQKILGSKGENWIKGQWFAKKRDDFIPGKSQFQLGDDPREVVTNYDVVPPSEADCWCVLGALEESAYRLGYNKRRQRAKTLGALTSLKNLAKERILKFRYWSGKNYSTDHVDTYNDDNRTEWKDMKKLLNDRIKQLKEEA